MLSAAGSIYYLLNKLRAVRKPLFGFAGKNLIPTLIIMVFVICIPATTYLTINNTEIRYSAEAEKELIINVYAVEKIGTQEQVAFSAVPFIDGQIIRGRNYDVYWTVTGSQDFEYVESGKNDLNQSYFLKLLPEGEYLVLVKVAGDSFEIKSSKTLILGN